MITCQVYKKVELLKFLEVEGLNLTLEENLVSDEYKDSEIYPRNYTASIRVFVSYDDLEKGEVVIEKIIAMSSNTPNEALLQLSRALEGESITIHKRIECEVTKEVTKGDAIAIPPLTHTDVEIINEETDYNYYDFKTDSAKVFDYSKYE